MAIDAFQRSVRAEQRESVRMLLELRGLKFPAVDGVARLAFRAELAAVDIRVAIRAMRADVREDEAHVALRALHFHVHAAQRVARVIVVEFRNVADRFPARARVAVFAGNRDRSVRILVRGCLRLGSLRRRCQI